MSIVGQLLYVALWVFFLLLIARLVMEYVFMFARDYKATGIVAAMLEIVWIVTDPPLKFLRRFIPPLRLGGISLDMSFLVLIVLVQIGLVVARSL